jgi:hypothetical protein
MVLETFWKFARRRLVVFSKASSRYHFPQRRYLVIIPSNRRVSQGARQVPLCSSSFNVGSP